MITTKITNDDDVDDDDDDDGGRGPISIWTHWTMDN
jgi:hypothetical protein